MPDHDPEEHRSNEEADGGSTGRQPPCQPQAHCALGTHNAQRYPLLLAVIGGTGWKETSRGVTLRVCACGTCDGGCDGVETDSGR